MSPGPFNSLIYASKLESAGVPKEQASIHALALADVLEMQVVTKGDLAAVEERMAARLAAAVVQLQTEMAEFKIEIRNEMAALERRVMAEIDGLRQELAAFKVDLLKWLTIISISQIGVTASVVAYIVHTR